MPWPVWHASVAGPMSRDILKALALSALGGVGDATAGEWYDWTGRVYHVRRRLTEAEQFITGPALDYRGTPNAAARYYAIKRELPPAAKRLAADELGFAP